MFLLCSIAPKTPVTHPRTGNTADAMCPTTTVCDTTPMQQPQEHEVRQQVEKIVASARFKDSGRSRRFLEFIVQQTLAGKSADLKENIVGVNVFDRNPDYDPRLDSIVRVEAGRLRTKLNDYYEQEGRDDRLVISLPKGSYVPDFTWRDLMPAETSPANSAPDMPIRAPKSSSRRNWLAAAAILVLASTSLMSVVLKPSSNPMDRIAVLPFTPYTESAHDRMIADQLTQKVTAEFVKLGTFDVVPSTSVRRFEDQRPGVRVIATALEADILLEARTTTDGDRIRIEARLSDGALDRKFWVGDKFVGNNIDELAQQIALATSGALASRR